MQKTLSLIGLLILLSACASPAATVPTPALSASASSDTATQPVATETLILQTPVPVESAFAPGNNSTAAPAPFFRVYGEGPIVSNGESGAWDDRFTDPGAVVVRDGVFHMFRNGFRAFPAESQVGYVTSPDGYTWTKQDDQPVFKTSDVPYAKIAIYASSALVEDDGTWVLYFYTWDSKEYPSASVIGRATSKNPMGPWVADEKPVLLPSPQAEDWDGKQVLAPHVLKTDTGYVMYYSGVGATGVQMIGMATSSDGVTWTKYDDPTTINARYTESEPVFEPGAQGEWDSGWVHQPRVLQTSSGWVMFYRGTKDNKGSSMKLGLATSKDGIHWDRSLLSPLLAPAAVPRAKYFWFTNLLLKDDTYFLFWEVDINESTEIYLATHRGSLMP